MAFQIEMFLTTQFKAAGDGLLRAELCQNILWITFQKNNRIFEFAISGKGVVNAQDRGFLCNLICPNRAALRAARWLVAMTQKIGWPM